MKTLHLAVTPGLIVYWLVDLWVCIYLCSMIGPLRKQKNVRAVVGIALLIVCELALPFLYPFAGKGE